MKLRKNIWKIKKGKSINLKGKMMDLKMIIENEIENGKKEKKKILIH